MRRFTILGIAREGWPIIAAVATVAAFLTAAASFLGLAFLITAAAAGFIITLWALWFFRDPERRTPADAGALVSAADGVVCFVGPGTPPPESGVAGPDASRLIRVSVFMNIFNVHVNRAPASGVVERIAYRPGRFFNASLDKSSEHNERLSLVLRRPDGRRIVVVQIAGLIARRIVCRVKQGDVLAAGERVGLIRFGSRVDHYVPQDHEFLAVIGHRVRAGETILARAPRSDPPITLAAPRAPSAAGARA
jgi:phosphatidylserine decarboxylase